ncbi:MAG TPA: RHS repeat-associated core domain-containing protein [Candidatus Marinimicrobia bacterium]|nr:RHS repeat-associated core domain-containing protein [Candidatus Neomarinimicrobiota bacterium]
MKKYTLNSINYCPKNGVHLTDQIMSSKALVDESGNIDQTRHYYPYGAIRTGTGNISDYQYSGKELDRTGFYYFGARYYDPNFKRWLSCDPAEQGWSPYVYCGGNPVNMVDPDGEFFIEAMIIGALFNTMMNAQNIDNIGDFLGYAAVGALAGGGGAFVGSAIAGAISFGGFAGGFVTGASGGFIGGFVGGSGNTWMSGANFREGLLAGVEAGGIGALTGGLLSGTVAGIDALKSNANFWNGKVYESGGNFGAKGKFLDEEIPAGHKPTDTGEIATTDNNPNYGKYGYTRDGGTRPHFGTDYVGDVDDNVYDMYDGTVTKIGLGKSYGPESVRVNSVLNGKNYNVDYGHLSKSIVAAGDVVRSGDLIGYMGRYGIPNGSPTHVHISVWRPLPGGYQGFVMPWWR